MNVTSELVQHLPILIILVIIIILAVILSFILRSLVKARLNKDGQDTPEDKIVNKDSDK